LSTGDIYYGLLIGFAIGFCTIVFIIGTTASIPTTYTGTVQATFISNSASNGSNTGQISINLSGHISVTCDLDRDVTNTASLVDLQPGDNVTIVQYSVGFIPNSCLVVNN